MVSDSKERLIIEQVQQKVAEFNEDQNKVESLKLELESILEVYEISVEELWEILHSAKKEVLNQNSFHWINFLKLNKEITTEDLRKKILERIQQKAEMLQETKQGVESLKTELEAISEAYGLSDDELKEIILKKKRNKPFHLLNSVSDQFSVSRQLSKTFNIGNNPALLMVTGLFAFMFAPLLLALLVFTILTNDED